MFYRDLFRMAQLLSFRVGLFHVGLPPAYPKVWSLSFISFHFSLRSESIGSWIFHAPGFPGFNHLISCYVCKYSNCRISPFKKFGELGIPGD